MTRINRLPVGLCLLSLLGLGQTPTGEVRGRVVDPSQAVIGTARVEITNAETNVTLTTAANEVGNFLIRNLNPGVYRLDVAAGGFKRYTRERLEVRVGDVLDLIVAMEVGAASESVTVTAETPLLETANAGVGHVIDTRRLLDLPTPGNSAIYMLQFTPGATTSTPPTNLWPPDALGSGGTTTIGGGRAGQNEFTIDGTPMMTRGGGFTMNPPQEMVQEIRVTTAGYDASMGRFSGGQVTMVMKSGGNALHGSALYQNLSRGLMAHDLFTNNFINNPATGPITSQKIDQAWPPQRVIRAQGNMSGPVWIPRLYDGRNRTFWTFGGDGVIRQRASRASYTVPTGPQREGDFSGLLALGSRYQIYDPDTIQPAAGGRYSRQPFAGNLVPKSRFDPIALKLLASFPLPNTTGNADGTSNYTDPNLADSPYLGYLGRVDHVFNDQHRMFVSFNMAYTDPTSDRYFHNDSTGTVRTRRQRGLTYDHTYTPSPAWVFNFRYGVNRFRDDTAPPSIGYDLAALGIAPALTRQLDAALTAMPQISITGQTGLSGGSGSRPRTTYHNLIAQGTNVRGNHTLRMGVESRIMGENVWSLGNIAPRYDFSQNWTRGPLDNSATAPIGQGLASFLLGRPTGGAIQINDSTAEMSRYWGLFLQDDWKLSRKLTLNFGLRWDYDSPTTERFDRTANGFAFGASSPVELAARANYARNPIAEVPFDQFRVQGGLLFANLGGQPRGLLDRELNNIAPRVGLAYQATSKTVVRAGYGLFFAAMGSDRIDSSQPGFSQSTSLEPTLDNGVTWRATMANPFPDGLKQPAGASQGLATYLGQGVTVVNSKLRSAYTQRFSVNIQQLLPRRFLLDVGYMGNVSSKLPVSVDLNPVPEKYLSKSPARDQPVIDFLSLQVRNPFAGIADFVGTGLQTANVSKSQLLRPYPQFSSVGTTQDIGDASYNALQVRLERRFSAGYTVQSSYTYSKTMEAVSYLNSTDKALHRVVSELDQTHVFALTAIYELPFGKGKPLANSNRCVDLLAGGWSLQGVWQAQSGRPLAWGNIIFMGDLKAIGLPRDQRGPDRWFNTEAGFNKDSAQQLSGNVRTFPLRLNGVRAPGINIVNLSLVKNIRLVEKLGLQFRAEAVDAFNETPLSAPNVTPTSGAFGTITTIGSGNTQRRITLGGKLIW